MYSRAIPRLDTVRVRGSFLTNARQPSPGGADRASIEAPFLFLKESGD
jgi:hypothetical protein